MAHETSNEASDAWRRMGEVSDTAVLLGLHQDKSTNSRTPFFLCELRIRFCEQIYAHDKVCLTVCLNSAVP